MFLSAEPRNIPGKEACRRHVKGANAHRKQEASVNNKAHTVLQQNLLIINYLHKNKQIK